MLYTITVITLWFLFGITAKGIIRGNNINAINSADLDKRKDSIAVYWMLRWERTALLLGPIGLWGAVRKSFKAGSSFALFKFSLKRHNKHVRVPWVPTYYAGRLIKTS